MTEKTRCFDNPMQHALVISCHNTGLGVIRALGSNGIPIIAISYDRNDIGQVSKYCEARIAIPHPEKEESGFVNRLLSLAPRYAGGLIFPCDDESLGAVSRNYAILAKHFVPTYPEWETIRNIFQKHYTYQIAQSIGIPHPRTLLADGERIDLDFIHEVGFPCLVKPTESHNYAKIFGKKLAKVGNLHELERECKKAKAAGFRTMIQEFIPGPDSENINYNSYTIDSRVVVDFTAKKVRLSPPESGVPCVVRSQDIEEVKPYAAAILERIKYCGYSCMEFKRDPHDGKYKLLEINGRYNRSIALSLKCGVNFPLMHYRHIAQGRMPDREPFRKNIYWIDIARDILAWIPYMKMKGHNPASILAPYVRPHVFCDASINDMKPFLRRIQMLFLRAYRTVFRQFSGGHAHGTRND